MRSEIDAWWQVLQTAFQWNPAQRDRLRYTFFYEQLVPRRTTMLQIADRIAEINERGLNRAEERLSASAESLRWSLLVTFGITLLGGIVLAVATIALTRRLEREVERRLNETTEARSDLQALSARLVRAQEEERRTLARELHDEVGQSLSAIIMEAGNAEAAVSAGEIRRRVSSIGSIAEKTLNIVRDLALLLRPSMLDDFGLLPALNWHAREMSKRTGLNVRISADPASDDLPDEHKTCIYRLVQEALNNAARHASARNLQVAVRNQADRVIFSVQDDGSGFDKASVRGLGLLGMEERVRRLGGTFHIDSQLGRGTTIAAELPLRNWQKRGRKWQKQKIMPPIRILLADDHAVVRDGLRALLDPQPDLVIVAEASDGRECIDLAEEHSPDVVMMDVAMPKMNGIEATRRILASNPSTAVVILSMHQDESYVLQSLKAGAKGYLLKDSPRENVLEAIRSAAKGLAFLSRKVSRMLQEDYIEQLQSKGLDDSYELLTDREREILQLLAEGRANKEVANLLNISPTTVETHRGHILRKLSLHGTADLILYAVRKRIIF